MALAVSCLVPAEGARRPPVILVHGAANSALVWTFWQRELAGRGWPTCAIDLRGHGRSDTLDLSRVSMADYAEDVLALAGQLRERPVFMGWSMGGLVAMMAAASGPAVACVALAPSLPAREADPSVQPRAGEFTAEEYGITSPDPRQQPAMPDLDLEERQVALASLCRESRYARDERRRGIVIQALPCPLLVVTGSRDAQWPASRYEGLWLKADRLSVEGASHWGLVLSRRALARAVPAVAEWMQKVTPSPAW